MPIGAVQKRTEVVPGEQDDQAVAVVEKALNAQNALGLLRRVVLADAGLVDPDRDLTPGLAAAVDADALPLRRCRKCGSLYLHRCQVTKYMLQST